MLERSIADEVEAAIKAGSTEKHLDTLRQVTDPFLLSADGSSGEQIELFGDVLFLNSQNKDKDKALKLSPLAVYENLGGFVFAVPLAEAVEALDFARENGNDAQRKLVPALSVTDNMIVSTVP